MAHPQTNTFLNALAEGLKASILPHCEAVPLPANTVLFDAQYPPRFVHFPTSGVASVVTQLADGGAVEVGLVGREGVAESLHLLGPQTGPTRCFMQIPGTGLRVRFKTFEQQFIQEPALRRLVLRYVQYSTLVVSQIAACNRLHPVEERLARWLLMAQDKIGGPHVELTQEFIAQMLGSRRSTVTVAAGMLQRGLDQTRTRPCAYSGQARTCERGVRMLFRCANSLQEPLHLEHGSVSAVQGRFFVSESWRESALHLRCARPRGKPSRPTMVPSFPCATLH